MGKVDRRGKALLPDGTCNFNNRLDVNSEENTLQTHHVCFTEEEKYISIDFLFVLLRKDGKMWAWLLGPLQSLVFLQPLYVLSSGHLPQGDAMLTAGLSSVLVMEFWLRCPFSSS